MLDKLNLPNDGRPKEFMIRIKDGEQPDANHRTQGDAMDTTIRVWCPICRIPVLVTIQQPLSLNPREETATCSQCAAPIEWAAVKWVIEESGLMKRDDLEWGYRR